MAHWVARLIRKLIVVSSNPIKLCKWIILRQIFSTRPLDQSKSLNSLYMRIVLKYVYMFIVRRVSYYYLREKLFNSFYPDFLNLSICKKMFNRTLLLAGHMKILPFLVLWPLSLFLFYRCCWTFVEIDRYRNSNCLCRSAE